MEDKKISNQESLELITKMIQVSRGKVRHASIYFLLWGWIVVIGSLGQFVLEFQFNYQYPYIIWLIGIPGIIYTYWHASKRGRSSTVRTYTDGILSKTWLGYLACLLIIIPFGGYFNYHITALIMMFAGFATFVSGLVINYKPLYLGAILFWILTPLALYVGVSYSPLVLLGAISFGYLLPGYLLRRSK